MRTKTTWAIAILGFAPVLVLADDITYTAIPIAGLSGALSSAASSVNNAGQVTGYSYLSPNPGAVIHAFMSSNGNAIDLGTLGGSVSSGTAVNNSGQVAGYSEITGDTNFHAFLYTNGIMEDLGALAGGESAALGLNDLGQATGSSTTTAVGNDHAVIFSNGVVKDLGTLPSTASANYSVGNAINNSGQVVGISAVADGIYRAFLYSGNTMIDLGTLGGDSSDAIAINNSGQVVGYADLAGSQFGHAFLDTNGTMKDLGTLGGNSSTAWSINDSGEIVGTSAISGDFITDAFLDFGGNMYDLNSIVTGGIAPGDHLSIATSINDDGWIVAEGNSLTSDPNYYLLEPNAQLQTAPEPSSLFLLLLGFGILRFFPSTNRSLATRGRS